MISLKPSKGKILIAEPSILGDDSFNRSVILLSEHNDSGSIGFILNKPLDYTIKDLIPDIDATFRIYNGGPVEQDNLYFIHKTPSLIPNSVEISYGIFWGGDFDSVKDLINQKKIKEDDIRFFLGYSGWENNQLVNELISNSWILTENVYKASIIEKKDISFWKEKMLEFGGDYSIWSNAPEDPTYN